MAYKFIPRLLITQNIKIGENILIKDEQHHYIFNVLKKQKNDVVLIFNGQSDEYESTITEVSKKNSVLTANKITKTFKQPQQINLYISPIHKDKYKLAIEKSIELGATNITPVICQRTNVKPIPNEKINAIITMATQQCERLDIANYNNPITFNEFIEEKQNKSNEFTIICSENKDGENIRNLYNKNINSDIINILIGPEGGFDKQEFEVYKNIETIHKASLGPLILRAETAAIVAISTIASIFW